MTTTQANSVDMTHMVNPSTFKHGTRKYCVESRNPHTGQLTLEQLPFVEATELQLTRKFFIDNPNLTRASQETICKWYNDKNIYFRPKTW